MTEIEAKDIIEKYEALLAAAASAARAWESKPSRLHLQFKEGEPCLVEVVIETSGDLYLDERKTPLTWSAIALAQQGPQLRV